MTKLLEWLFCFTVISGIWFAVITSNSTFVKEWHKTILSLPIASLVLFGLYTVTVVLYRVFTFNTCESAAVELQKQIEEARKDLQSKGVILSRKTNTPPTS
nr:PREDICTED: dolichol-phosphate mannosyltransferase subunit 3 [Linepithema humile]